MKKGKHNPVGPKPQTLNPEQFWNSELHLRGLHSERLGHATRHSGHAQVEALLPHELFGM